MGTGEEYTEHRACLHEDEAFYKVNHVIVIHMIVVPGAAKTLHTEKLTDL